MSYFADTYAPCIFALASVIWKSNSPCSFNELAMAGRSFQQIGLARSSGSSQTFSMDVHIPWLIFLLGEKFQGCVSSPRLAELCYHPPWAAVPHPPTPTRYLGQMLDSCPIPLSPIRGRSLKVMLLLSNSQSCVTSIGHLSLFLGQCFEKPGHWVCTSLLSLPPEEEVPELCVTS